MAKIGFNWLLATMSGKACNHDDVYTKTNKQTGASYAVKLCNPVDGEHATAAQIRQRNKFGAICHAVSEWINREKSANDGDGSVAYNKALAAYKSQHKIGSFRGYITSKCVTYDDATGNITIEVGNTKDTMTPSTSGGDNGGGTTPTPNPSGGEDNGTF